MTLFFFFLLVFHMCKLVTQTERSNKLPHSNNTLSCMPAHKCRSVPSPRGSARISIQKGVGVLGWLSDLKGATRLVLKQHYDHFFI